MGLVLVALRMLWLLLVLVWLWLWLVLLPIRLVEFVCDDGGAGEDVGAVAGGAGRCGGRRGVSCVCATSAAASAAFDGGGPGVPSDCHLVSCQVVNVGV